MLIKSKAQIEAWPKWLMNLNPVRAENPDHIVRKLTSVPLTEKVQRRFVLNPSENNQVLQSVPQLTHIPATPTPSSITPQNGEEGVEGGKEIRIKLDPIPPDDNAIKNGVETMEEDVSTEEQEEEQCPMDLVHQ